MKKFVIIAGMMAMAGALFLASPVSAQDNEAITAVLNDDGSATVTGTGWEGAPATLFVTVCTGADPTAENGGITEGNALQVCPTLMADGFTTNPERGDGGTTTYTISADTVGEVPEEGLVILQGELAAGTVWSANTVLTAGGAEEEPAEEEPEPAEEEPEPAEEPAEEGAGGDDEMDDGSEVDMEGSEEEGMEGGEEGMDDDMATDSMANTGSESGLLAVIGVSILLAGLFAVGIGRRFAKRS